MFEKRLEEIQNLLLKNYFFYGFLSFFISIKGLDEIDDTAIVEDEVLINKDSFLSFDDDTAMNLICRLIDRLFEHEEEYGPGDLMYAIPVVISKIQDVKLDVNGSKAIDIFSVFSEGDKDGDIPGWAKRYMAELKEESEVDWKRILHEFVQDCSMDYSFSPPDRRFSDSAFFLPDYHESGAEIKKVLFMIDTSGSMSEEDVSTAFKEVRSAVDQFDSKLSGWLGFFDAEVIPPVEFSSVEELKHIKAFGGGGTSFDPIFSYVKEHMSENLPASIVILTDGYAPFPDESVAGGIQVLWLIVNSDVKPPWGRVARI